MPKHFLSFLLLFLPFLCSAQEPDPTVYFHPEPDSDSTVYFRSYPDKFNFQLLLRSRPTRLQLAGADNRLEFRPNSRPQIGIGGSIVNVGFAFYLRVPESIGRELSIFGETDYTDLQFNYYRSHFAFNFHYLKYSGFYVNNAADFDTPPFVPLYPLGKDVSMEGASLIGTYLLNTDRISFRAPYNNADRQLISAGSFLAMAELSHYVLGSDSLVLPQSFIPFFDGSNLQGGSFSSFSLMPGYTGTLVANEFYLNITLAAGPDFQYNLYNTIDESGKNWFVAGKVNGQAALGFDNDKLFGSLVFTVSRRRMGADQLVIGNDTGKIVLSVGHRFQETKWMNRIRTSRLYEKVMNPLSFFK